MEVESLASAVETVTGLELERPVSVTRPAVGYAWDTFVVTDAASTGLVARIAPEGGTMEPYDPEIEVRALAASAGAVPAPEVLGVDRSGRLLGRPFSVQTLMPGEVLALGAITDEADRSRYRTTFARTLGVLHAHGRQPGCDVVDAYRAELARLGDEVHRVALHRQPGLEVGLGWLHANLTVSDDRAVRCHGDFRFANLLWTGPGELGAVLDWERCWIGDPMADVAFTRQFSGWCAVDGDVIAAYEQASGIRVDEARVAYGLRFERVRAYLSALRVMRAVVEGRVTDLRLAHIAEAGEAGMWELTEWDAEPMVFDLPDSGPDWIGALPDLDAAPRPVCLDPDDPDEVRRTAFAWRDRPLRKNRRTWQ